MGRTAGSLLLVTCVSLQPVKGRGGDSLLRAAVCGSASDLNPCIPGTERAKRRRQVPVVLGCRPSPHHLQTGVAEVGVWQSRGIFLCVCAKG